MQRSVPRIHLLGIVVISYKRALWLKRCLQSLLKAQASARYTRFQIRVLINGYDPESLSVAKSLAGDALLVQAIDRPLSPAAARNLLLQNLQSNGEDWTYFIDDDAYLDEGYFSKFEESLRMFPNVVALGGPNLTPPNSSLFQKATGLAMASPFGTVISNARYKKLGGIRPCDESALILCNLFIKTDFLRDNPFPPHLVSAEENWLLQILTLKKQSIVYNPELYVWHERRSTLSAFTRQIYSYGFGRGQNIFRRTWAIKVPHLVPSLCIIWAMLATLSTLLSHSYPASLVNFAGVYSIAVLISTSLSFIRSPASFKTTLVSGALFPVIHFFYGVGLLLGFANALRDERRV